MKTLSIQQPWASLICAGIKDVENRTWKAAEIPGRILIHASAKKVAKDFENTIPLNWLIAFEQNQIFGNLPFYEDMPTSAIIGYGTVTAFKTKTDSMWDSGDDMIKWVFEDVYLFDKPIEGVKGKLGLFDYPLDENNLPSAHKVELRFPVLDGTEMIVPITDTIIEAIANGADDFRVSLNDRLYDTVTDKDGNDKVIKTIRFVGASKSAVCIAEEAGVFSQVNEETNEPIFEIGLHGEELEWLYFGAILKDAKITDPV